MKLAAELPRYQPPPGLSMIKGASMNSKAGAGGSGNAGGADEGTGEVPPPDNSLMGFLKRYWYIVLPLALNVFMSSAEPPKPEGEGGGQQQQQGGTQQAASAPQRQAPAAAPASASSSSKVRSRRGKRG